MAQFHGSMVALVTPFKGGQVDEPALRALAKWQIEEGTDGLVPCGTTGEGATLTAEEHARVVRICVEEARGKAPVIAGCGTNATASTIENVRRAREAGADAALVVTPYYNKPTPEGLFRHFEAVARQGGLPVILYNVPSRTSFGLRFGLIFTVSGMGIAFGCGGATSFGSECATAADSLATIFSVCRSRGNGIALAPTSVAEIASPVIVSPLPHSFREKPIHDP